MPLISLHHLMTYTLAIGDRTYSSWSLRGWLLFEKFNLPVKIKTARMNTDEFPALLEQFKPARLVPVMKTPEGTVVSDTLAMAETLAERHPEAQLWPTDPAARSFARSITAEMHSGFTALRDACSMDLSRSYLGYQSSPAVQVDLTRLEKLWTIAKEQFGKSGPWLFGDYCIADAFFAPVAARVAGFKLTLGPLGASYVDTHLADTAFRRWRAMGIAQNYEQSVYDLDLPLGTWPGPEPIAATVADGGIPENNTCPYSGDLSVDYLAIDGRIFGFCNEFCRDKTLADPLAWPAFVKIYEN